jgi:hypothetical protein
MILFIIISVVYIISIAIVDGAFNRLIFREHRTKPYHSPEKQQILGMWEWKVVGLLYLLVIPVIIPTIVSYALGGLYYAMIYLTVFCVIQWDVIFGKIVFGHWLGDTPHMALPLIGWFTMPLLKAVQLRLVLAIVLLTGLISLKTFGSQ